MKKTPLNQLLLLVAIATVCLGATNCSNMRASLLGDSSPDTAPNIRDIPGLYKVSYQSLPESACTAELSTALPRKESYLSIESLTAGAEQDSAPNTLSYRFCDSAEECNDKELEPIQFLWQEGEGIAHFEHAEVRLTPLGRYHHGCDMMLQTATLRPTASGLEMNFHHARGTHPVEGDEHCTPESARERKALLDCSTSAQLTLVRHLLDGHAAN